MNPLSWEVMLALQGFIGNASVVNGYFFDWRALLEPEQYDLDDPRDAFDPVAFVCEDDDVTDKTFNSGDASTINIVIESYIPVGLNNAQFLAHRARSDLKKCIPRKTGGNLPKGAHSLQTVSALVLQKPQGLAFVVVQVRLRVSLQETQ